MPRPILALVVVLSFLAATWAAGPETGTASWYGYPFHGRPAASGEVYDMETLTAAHPSLPFNTRVRVVNLENGKAVEVRITDRGPFIPGRIIDLSHAAARSLGMIIPGTVPVSIEVIGTIEDPTPSPAPIPAVAPALFRQPSPPPAPAVPPPGLFFVQAGSFIDRENAEHLRDRLEEQFGAARLVPREGDPVLWRVWVGSGSEPQSARDLSDRVREEGGIRAAFVVRSGA